MSDLFSFNAHNELGTVISVDTSQIFIDVHNSEIMTKLGVGHLVAIKSHSEFQLLIGTIEKISRTVTEKLDFESDEELIFQDQPNDIVKVVLVGTFKSVDGEKRNIFKRGADIFPQIDSESYLIDGINLQRFMNLLGEEIGDDERLNIGHFINDRTAKAILDGDKLFQRHASILGSTGSGKSWCVATILEKASQLDFPNLIVFDMHGEYSPLTKGKDKIAEGYRIAGPGDLEGNEENVIFLPYWLLNREEVLSMILDRNDNNAPNQASRFTLHIKKLKEDTLEENEKEETLKTFTVDSPTD
ncbi:ATP-binding protein [Virgibacillus sp. 179-BFC.A HS]|uniref:ATP-binding protein n=1 Tax=Tigheibacillus jepli TaxID=3035914 RepID=A0ABU5CLI1_9BACI|nr:ATP-binding protein [Virgibacillus sp. 179-BFC.A HS]MDY0407227.1 ATP-binding protein [Virgibacillus sp. 179-BFC.A HS]